MTSPDDTRALAIGRAVLALLEQIAPPAERPDDLVPLRDGARIAATSVFVVRAAIRSGELAAVGKQRDRSVRRAELQRWIESRTHKPVAGADDLDLERRMKRLAGGSR